MGNILAVSACQAAAQALGLGDRTSRIVTPGLYEIRPKGCFKWLDIGVIVGGAYFNPNTGVPANPTSEGAPICEVTDTTEAESHETATTTTTTETAAPETTEA